MRGKSLGGSPEWHYQLKGETAGTVSPEELLEKAQSGEITPETLVWRRGMRRWVPARKVKGLFDAVASPQPRRPAPKSAPPPLPKARKRAGQAAERPAGAAKKTRLTWPDVAGVAIVNVVPAVALLFQRWDVGILILLYWMENVVLGVDNVLRMIVAKPDYSSGKIRLVGPWVEIREGSSVIRAGNSSKFGDILFFLIHYGGFTLGHGFFVLMLIVSDAGAESFEDIESVLRPHVPLLAVALALTVADYAWSFFDEYIRGKGYTKTHHSCLFLRPYGRVLVLHLVILGGAFVLIQLAASPATALLLVAFKVFMDVRRVARASKSNDESST